MPKTNLRDILKTLSKWSSTAIKSSILYFFHKDKLQHHLINAKNHIKKHHKKYLWGTALSGGGFFTVKALIVLAGVFGIIGHS